MSERRARQLRAVPNAIPGEGSTAHRFTPQQRALIERHVIAVNAAQGALTTVFVGVVAGMGVDIDVYECQLAPDLNGFTVTLKATDAKPG